MARKTKLSGQEEKLLCLIPWGWDERTNTRDLADRFFEGRRRPPHAIVSVGGFIRSIARKTREADMGFHLYRSERLGPCPSEIWLEERKSEARPRRRAR